MVGHGRRGLTKIAKNHTHIDSVVPSTMLHCAKNRRFAQQDVQGDKHGSAKPLIRLADGFPCANKARSGKGDCCLASSPGSTARAHRGLVAGVRASATQLEPTVVWWRPCVRVENWPPPSVSGA